MQKYYTFGMQLKVDDKKIQDFLVAISSSINDMNEPVTGHNIDYKIKNGKIYIEVTVNFADETKMVFSKVADFGIDLEFLSLTEEELAATMIAQGLAVAPEDQQLQPAIGFAIPTDDDYYDDDEEE